MHSDGVFSEEVRATRFLEGEGVLVVRDRSLFRPGFEGFCRRLAVSAVGLGGVRSAFVCLATGTCRLEFEGSRFSASEMAEWFAEAVRVASTASHDGPGGWVSLRVDSIGGAEASWETTLENRGSFRLRHQGLIDQRDLAGQVARELAEGPGVASSRVTFWAGELEVRYDREGVCASEVLSAAASAYRRVLDPARLNGHDAEVPEVATGLRRVGLLAMASGSFGLTVVALIVPGVPTVPFLLATSYFLVRSSPSLNERLLRSRFFGPILTDLEFGHGLRQINKIKLVVFSLTMGLVTVLLISPTWPVLFVMLGVSSAGMFAISRIPGLPEIGEASETRPTMVAAPGT